MISVVIPVYKVEKYIDACIQSLLAQSYRDFEIVLVNDGTPDRSAVFAKEILESQNDIPYQVINTENRGVSAARNTGIEYANGDQIVMIDSDDVIDVNFLFDFAALVKAHPGANIFSCGFTVVDEDHCHTFSHKDGMKTKVLTREDSQLAFFYRRIKFLLPTLMLKRSFLIENKIIFDERVRYSEDVQFIWRCLAYNYREVVHLYKNNYNYVLHAGSTMTASGIEKILTFCGGLDRLYEETKGRYCEPVNTNLISKMYFSILHGTAKMLKYNDFKTVYDKANCRNKIISIVSSPDKKSGVVASVLLISKRLGYLIMKVL